MILANGLNSGSTVSGGCPGHFSSTLLENILSSGELDNHINRTLIPTYRKRYYRMKRAIEEHLFPLGITLDMGTPYQNGTGPDSPVLAGGFFLYLHFPNHLPPVTEIASFAESGFNLKFAPGAIFTVMGDSGSQERAKTSFGEGARLCWAWNEEDILVEGIQRLALVVKTVSSRAI